MALNSCRLNVKGDIAFCKQHFPTRRTILFDTIGDQLSTQSDSTNRVVSHHKSVCPPRVGRKRTL